MQNTSRIQTHPNTLIKDFFVAGLTQETLIDRVTRGYKHQVNIVPEMLFSMFKNYQDVVDHLKFVFPNKISIQCQSENVAPKFFTFVSTDDQGFIAFYHCLVFNEQFTKKEISANFIPSAVELKKQQKMMEKAIERRNSPAASLYQKRSTSSSLLLNKNEPEDQFEMEFDTQPQDLYQQRQLKLQQKRNNQTRALKASEMGVSYVPNNTAMSLSSDAFFKRQNPETKQKELTLEELVKGLGEDRVSELDIPMLKPQPQSATDKVYNIQRTVAKTISKHSSQIDSVIHETEEEHNDMKQSNRKSSNDSSLPNTGKFGGTILDQIKQIRESEETPKQISCELASESVGSAYEEERYSSVDHQSSKDEVEIFYAPIAFVISTEIENHDIFREVLIELFDSIRKPGTYFSDFQSNRKLAFADFLAHIAFMKTIPTPTFQTIYNIEFFQKTLVVEEGAFSQIPNKSQIPIRMLFDVLDVRSIFYCWKALLFDCTLVIISEQQSLQFYVAEGLKQLLFPLTWQNSYIQPANRELLDYAESPSPVLLCTSPLDGTYDYFENLCNESGFKNLAILDVDGCYTNDLNFPCLSDERLKLQTLNKLKHKKLSKCDLAFADLFAVDESDHSDQFVSDVRQTFFNFLKPYLEVIDPQDEPESSCIREQFRDKKNQANCIFGNYFDTEKYLKIVGQSESVEFAKRLVNSSQFIHFCDDFFEEELSNYKMFYAIIANSHQDVNDFTEEQKNMMEDQMFEIQRRVSTVISEEMDENQSPDHINREKGFGVDTQIRKKNSKEWPQFEPVCIDWRMPSDNQRVMLFERMEYLMMDHFKHQQDLYNSAHEVQLNQINITWEVCKSSFEHFESLIQKIKDLYPRKLAAYQKQLFFANGFQQESEEGSQTGGRDVSDNDCDSIKKAAHQSTLKRLLTETGKLNQEMNNDMESEEQGTSSQSDAHSNNSFSSNAKSGLKEIPQNIRLRRALSLSTNVDQIIQKAQNQAANSKNRIAKLMYGSVGLIQFLRDLFENFRVCDKHELNYYFTLRFQIAKMDQYPESIDFFSYPDANFKYKLHYQTEEDRSIFEQPSNEPFAMPNQRQKCKTVKNLPFRKRSEKKYVPAQLVQRMACPVRSTKITNFEANHISQTIWVIPKSWQEHFQLQKQTYQFLMLKVKFYTSFETHEQQLNLAFNELLAFPQREYQLFPKTRFNTFLYALSYEQKRSIWTHKKRDSDKFQLKYLFDQMAAEEKGKEFLSIDSSQFQDICVISDMESSSIKNSLRRSDSSFKDTKLTKMAKHRSEQMEFLNSFSENLNLKMKKDKSVQQIVQKQSFLQKLFGPKSPRKQNTQSQKQLYVMTDLSIGRSSHNLGELKTPRSFQSTNDFFSCKQSCKLINSSASHEETKTVGDSQEVSKRSFETIPCLDGEEKVEDLLVQIIQFWKKSIHLADTKRGKFRPEDVPNLREKLIKIKTCAQDLKRYKFEFKFNASNRKQVFWLNLLNFMTLFRLAEVSIVKPKQIPHLNNYSVWQIFQESNSIYLHDCKLSWYLIHHSILRANLEQPTIAQFMKPKQDKKSLPESIKDLVVDEPIDFISAGVYMPMRNMGCLEVFKTETVAKQLREIFQKSYGSKIYAKKNNFLIRVPRHLQWYHRDYMRSEPKNKKEDYFGIFKLMIEKKGIPDDSPQFMEMQRVLEQLENEKSKTGVSLHYFDLAGFKWEVSFVALRDHIQLVQI